MKLITSLKRKGLSSSRMSTGMLIALPANAMHTPLLCAGLSESYVIVGLAMVLFSMPLEPPTTSRMGFSCRIDGLLGM